MSRKRRTPAGTSWCRSPPASTTRSARRARIRRCNALPSLAKPYGGLQNTDRACATVLRGAVEDRGARWVIRLGTRVKPDDASQQPAHGLKHITGGEISLPLVGLRASTQSVGEAGLGDGHEFTKTGDHVVFSSSRIEDAFLRLHLSHTRNVWTYREYLFRDWKSQKPNPECVPIFMDSICSWVSGISGISGGQSRWIYKPTDRRTPTLLAWFFSDPLQEAVIDKPFQYGFCLLGIDRTAKSPLTNILHRQLGLLIFNHPLDDHASVSFSVAKPNAAQSGTAVRPEIIPH
jgi:hypothetical protein